MQPKPSIRLWRLTAGHRGRFSAALAALLGATVIGFVEPLIPAMVIDGLSQRLTGQADDPAGGEGGGDGAGAAEAAPASEATETIAGLLGGPTSVLDYLLIAAVALLLLVALNGLLTYLKGRFAAQASESMARQLRNRLYDHLQHLTARYHDRAEAGDLVQRCTSDVETVRAFFSTQAVELGRASVMLIVVIPFMLWLNVTMTLVALALMPVLVVFAIVFFRRIKWVFRASDEAEARVTATLQENLTGIRVVRAFGRAEFEKQRFAGVNAEYRDHTYRLYRTMAVYWSLSDLMCFLQIGLVLMAGGYMAVRGMLSVGELYAFLAYTNMLLWPVRQMGRVLSEMGKAIVAMGRIGEILDQPVERDREGVQAPIVDAAGLSAAAAAPAAPAPRPPLAAPVSIDPAKAAGRIVFDNVSFAHREGMPVLDNVSFTVEPGTTLAILGPSGSGKSTIVQLLLRFYDYAHGSITIDGIELARIPRKQARQLMAVVMQEPFLYSRTVRENIRFGHHDASESQVREAASTAFVHETINGFREGYNTRVGERGVKLSGGQRQRIVLARALVKNPPVLILDDALSAVDTGTEHAILDALEQRRGRQSTIIIGHRLSTLQRADEILVLDEGRVVQRGTHAQLLGEDGLYQRLFAIQTALRRDVVEAAAAGAGATAEARAGAGQGLRDAGVTEGGGGDGR